MADTKIKTAEPFTYYDMAKLLREMSALVGKFPHTFIEQINNVEEEELSDLKTRAENVLNTLKGVEAAINDKVAELITQSEDHYRRVEAANRQLKGRLESLPQFAVHVPHGCKSLIELAQQCSDMTDEQWSRVVELAKALRT